MGGGSHCRCEHRREKAGAAEALGGGVQSLQEVTEEVGEGCGRRGRGRSCVAASGLASEGTWSHSSRKAPPLQVEAGLPPEALGDLTRLSSLPR